MIPAWWSLVLAATGLLGLWLVGSGRPSGFAVGAAVQGLWFAYAVVTRQWWFIASALAYAVVNVRGLRRWRRTARRGGAGPDCECIHRQ